jgi:siroheme synthase
VDIPGFVSLVGAGPGRPDLITVRGLRALEAAQVVLYDPALEAGFRDLFPPQAQTVPVSGRHGADAAAAQRLMIEHAAQGRRVVRLMEGDPLVFGPGGEMAEALEAAGVPFEIIPGISALQTGAAASGIPLFYPGLSRRLTILEEGHMSGEDGPWYALAAEGGTLAVRLGARRLGPFASNLLWHGAPPLTPVALVEDALGPEQVTTLSTLGVAAGGALRSTTAGTGLLLVGAALRHRTHPELPEARPGVLPGPGGEWQSDQGRGERRIG